MAALLSTLVSGVPPVAAQDSNQLQARDLDGDSTTIEAYYYSPLDLTWLADANIGKTETFGLVRGSITDYGLEVNADGEMLRGALAAYLDGMNQAGYLGHSNWRLPVALPFDDPTCESRSSSGGSEITWGTGCSGPEVGHLNLFLAAAFGDLEDSPFVGLDSGKRWLGSNGPAGRHFFEFGGDGNLQFCGVGRCTAGKVWAVHDGDIGQSVSPECVDYEPLNDGWGWDGTQSCRLPICVDYVPLNDGWGWDGTRSCRLPICVDYPPLNDGWGWNGFESCRLEVVAEDSPNV